MLSADFIQQLSQRALAARHRVLVVISGEADWVEQQIKFIPLSSDDCLWLGCDSAIPVPHVPDIKGVGEHLKCLAAKQASRCLGREYRQIVVDGFAGFNPNGFGQVSGTLVAGGVMYLLIPALDQWPQFADPEKAAIATEPYTAENVANRFIQRLAELAATSSDIVMLRQGAASPEITVVPEKATGLKEEPVQEATADSACDWPYRSAQQQQIAGHMLAQLQRRQPKVQVLTADRGRGKSACLGLVAAELLREAGHNVLIIAPALPAVESLFSAAQLLLPDAEVSAGLITYQGLEIRFAQPDQVLQHWPRADVMLVDEAAAIPAPVLTRLLAHYPRCAFASTIHGYEGTGQGFEVRFKALLNDKRPGWHDLKITTPVRWAEGDPLEAFTYQALLLDASPVPLAADFRPEQSDLVVRRIDRDQLATDSQLLSQVFGLLVLAHYRTTPGDLRIMLDSPNLQVWGAFADEALLGTMLVAEEGRLDAGLAAAVYAGKRRPKGHLIPQTLLAQEAIASAGESSGLRVMRIAVRPELQRRGIAANMLETLYIKACQSGYDWLGSGFGLTAELHQFWQHGGFRLARIGLTRDSISATHGAIMLRPCSASGAALLQQAEQRLAGQLLWLFGTKLADLDSALVQQLLAAQNNSADQAGSSQLKLTNAEWLELNSFAVDYRQFDSCRWQLQQFICDCGQAGLLQYLSGRQLQITVQVMLQGHDWNQLELSGQQSSRTLLQEARDAVSCLLQHCVSEG